MKANTLPVSLFGFIAVFLLSGLLFGTVTTAHAADTQKLTGDYIWENGGSDGPLEAIFTPTGDGQWEVAFHFTFNGQPHTYEGFAKGSLSEGELEGEVKNENRRRTFTFTGAFEQGLFRGTHAEIRRGKARYMGTLTLRN